MHPVQWSSVKIIPLPYSQLINSIGGTNKLDYIIFTIYIMKIQDHFP